MDFIRKVDNPSSYKISETVRLRQGAKAGPWCGLTLPIAMIFSCLKYHDTISDNYILATVCAMVSTVYLYMNLLGKQPTVTHAAAFSVACLGSFIPVTTVGSTVRVICSLVLVNMKSYFFLSTLLKRFPFSFSIGEAILVVQGATVFVFITLLNCLMNYKNPGALFCQIFLIGVGVFLLGVNLIPEFQRLIPFTFFLMIVMGALTLPTLVLVLQENPVSWFLYDFLFLNLTRVLLIFYWIVCTVSALLVAWWFGSGSSITLTVLRKYFHGVIIAIYLPGIFLDFDLLFVASVIVLAAFILLESARLYNLEYLGDILNTSMNGFLDEKDQGVLILTHIYLLVGCSLPLWIFPLQAATSVSDYLLLCSGVVSLGIGDTAASIGGTLWGRTKYPGSSKSVEGTLCSILAEIGFFFAMFYSGLFGVSSYLPWGSFVMSAVVSSLVEAYTTQVDNLVLPLVMYIVLII